MNMLSWIYNNMRRAPAVVIFHAIPMAIAWYVGRHALWWMFCAFYALETGGLTHFGHSPHPESQIAYGEIWIGWMCAYLVGAWMMQSHWMWSAYANIGKAENISPTLLFLVTPKQELGWAGLFFLPISCALFAPYAIAQLSLAVIGLLGGRALVAALMRGRSRHAEVINISAGSPWRAR